MGCHDIRYCTLYVMTYEVVCSHCKRYSMFWATHCSFSAPYSMLYRIWYGIRCFIWFKLWGLNGLPWAWMTSASFAYSSRYADCSITGTLPVLLQQPDSIATSCLLIQPRLASPPISGLPWNYFRFPGLQLGAAAQHAENCSTGMLCHCTATTAAARAQQAAASVRCARHEFVTLLILE
jgi:hypothetical protein